MSSVTMVTAYSSSIQPVFRSGYLDSFTVTLHSPSRRPVGQYKGIVGDFWKMAEIPISHLRPQSIATEAILTSI